MAPSKVLLLSLAFVAIILVSSEAVSARELAETTQTGHRATSNKKTSLRYVKGGKLRRTIP
ncbi:hypothetical protein CRG98_002064 [Punica granatum]|uniref:Uncharacterized protein n=1 Tax=Punica granatum TaxID=22663 RepID=A0A2I0L9T8_PUNGR|nr:hypothetical protein CRG98_002064 [Punica granatum]